MRDGIPITELKVRLNDSLPEILFDILRDVKPDGRNRWKGLAPNGDKIAVETGGAKKGYVYDTAGNSRGDGNLFNLVLAHHCDGNLFKACRFCERILGLDPSWWQPDRARAERARLEEKKAATEGEKDRRERFETWRREYLRGTPLTPESLSGRYLSGRGCPLSALLRDAISPYGGTPVMLAPMIDPSTLGIKAIHVIKLVERDGRVIKSSAKPVKFTPGYPSGCLMPLYQGKSGLSLKQSFQKNLREAVMIGEGIENCLTAQVEFPDLRLFAAGSVGNLSNARLPLRFSPVVLLRDREKPGNMGAAEARKSAIERWLREGRRVEIIDPPARFKDLNDAARAFAKR